MELGVFVKDCSVSEDDTCNLFEIASYLKVAYLEKQLEKLQTENEVMREALESISMDTVEVGFYVEPTWAAQVAREALEKLKQKDEVKE